jgi:hypothetical protein
VGRPAAQGTFDPFQPLQFRRWPGELFGMLRHSHRAFLRKVEDLRPAGTY